MYCYAIGNKSKKLIDIIHKWLLIELKKKERKKKKKNIMSILNNDRLNHILELSSEYDFDSGDY